MRVHDGDEVAAGDRLTEGPINPFDILNIKGVQAAQAYLVNEIQEVYRLQGVSINDKHIETIVRQMLRKVQVEGRRRHALPRGRPGGAGPSSRRRTSGVVREGGNAATYRPLLLGITKASLTTESFISAASFQETTRVLTEAAIDRQDGLPARPEGERDHGPPDPGRHGPQGVRVLQVAEDELKSLQSAVAARKALEEEAMAAVASKAEQQAQSLMEEGLMLFPEDSGEAEALAGGGADSRTTRRSRGPAGPAHGPAPRG